MTMDREEREGDANFKDPHVIGKGPFWILCTAICVHTILDKETPVAVKQGPDDGFLSNFLA